VRMTVQARIAGRARAGRVLGRASRTVAAGRRATVAVRLRPRDRRRVRRGTLRLVADVTTPGGPRWRTRVPARR
jgi:hypothetical protein